jgi:hypothetical protein
MDKPTIELRQSKTDFRVCVKGSPNNSFIWCFREYYDAFTLAQNLDYNGLAIFPEKDTPNISLKQI